VSRAPGATSASARHDGTGGGGGTRAGAAEGIVALLCRRGRLLVAEPFFTDSPTGWGGRGSRLTMERDARAGIGDLVLVRPSKGAGRARLLRRIGRPDVAADVLEALMLDRGLRRRFDPAVERAADEMRDRGVDEDSQRRDLTGLTTFTIDPATGLDFDDAISAERLDGGRIRVWVHIADVSAHVAPGTAVDREAARRATSVYLPGRVEPMLPEALSDDACSLVPMRDRSAVTVELDFDAARVRRAAFYRSTIRSDARLDYDRVDRIFAGDEVAQEPWAAPLDAARDVAAALQERRLAQSALALETSEPEFRFDRDGHVAESRPSEQTESHRLVEHLMIAANEQVARLLHERRLAQSALELETTEPEFRFDPGGHVAESRPSEQTESHRLVEHLMIAANEQVARLLDDRAVPTLYRVHEQPDGESALRLVEQLASLGVATPPVAEHMSSAEAAEVVAACSRAVSKHVRRTGHTPSGAPRGRDALTFLVLRALKQAYYSPKNLGHAGLGLTRYCHFTSPIRRYPDLVAHRALLSAVGGGEIQPRPGDMEEVGAWSSARERDAISLERLGDRIAGAFLLERELFERGWDEEFDGEVSGLIGAGAFVRFGGTPFGAQAAHEGLLPLRRLRGDWWELNEAGTILTGERTGETIRLGDPVRVKVERVETARGRVDLVPVER